MPMQRVQNQRQMFNQPMMMQNQQRPMVAKQTYNPSDYSNYEVIFDSKRDGLNHFVVYDSKRDGPNSPLRSMYANDPSLTTIFDTKEHGWNHPWVVYDSKRDGARNF